MRGALEFAKAADQRPAKFRDARTTAANSTDGPGRRRVLDRSIQIVQQQPGAPVTHVELSRRQRKRSQAFDFLEQGNLARAYGARPREIDAYPHTRPASPGRALCPGFHLLSTVR